MWTSILSLFGSSKIYVAIAVSFCFILGYVHFIRKENKELTKQVIVQQEDLKKVIKVNQDNQHIEEKVQKAIQNSKETKELALQKVQELKTQELKKEKEDEVIKSCDFVLIEF